MFDAVQTFSANLAGLMAGVAVGAAWISGIVSPNCSYDRLDYSRADGHIRELLLRSSGMIAAMLLAAAALAMIGGAIGAAVLCGLAAIGFFSNRWTLAPQKARQVAPGVKKRPSKKNQRVVAVSLTLMFTAVAAIGGALAVFGV